jgi:hypothetical protein
MGCGWGSGGARVGLGRAQWGAGGAWVGRRRESGGVQVGLKYLQNNCVYAI